MKKYILTALVVFIHSFSFSQTDKAKALVNEGIVLHDKGEYEVH